MPEDSKDVEYLAPSITHMKQKSYEKPTLPAVTHMNDLSNNLQSHSKKPLEDFTIEDNKVTATSKQRE